MQHKNQPAANMHIPAYNPSNYMPLLAASVQRVPVIDKLLIPKSVSIEQSCAILALIEVDTSLTSIIRLAVCYRSLLDRI